MSPSVREELLRWLPECAVLVVTASDMLRVLDAPAGSIQIFSHEVEETVGKVPTEIAEKVRGILVGMSGDILLLREEYPDLSVQIWIDQETCTVNILVALGEVCEALGFAELVQKGEEMRAMFRIVVPVA